MRALVFVPAIICAALIPVTVSAQDLVGAGCFGRTYDRHHLEQNSHQNVREIIATMSQSSDESTSLRMRVFFRDDPREYSADSGCFYNGDGRCFIDCDGGTITPTLTESGEMRLETLGLRAETDEALAGEENEEGCADPITRNIADNTPSDSEEPTVFILYPRDERECAWSVD